MRLLPGLVLIISLLSATTVEARLFRQTYGSIVPAAEGCAPTADGGGCTWNWNQDYFVPRHSSTCRYGLTSPCQSSCTTSPACKRCHPFVPGYCTIYGPCHYGRRNHVYGAYCGCQPVPTCGACCGAASVASACACNVNLAAVCGRWVVEAPLYNVEPSHLDILGSIPVEGGDLLTRTDFSQLGNERGGQQLLQPQGAMPTLPGLPAAGLPSSGPLIQP